MNKTSRIFVAGHRGLAGSAILRRLQREGYSNLLLRSRAEVDLTRQTAVERFFTEERPDIVILAAAKVGGIMANMTAPANFICENLLIQTHVIEAAFNAEVERLIFLGSSCIYPKHAPQPIQEECLLTGSLEPTNDSYAVAKIAGIKMCQAFRTQYGFDAVSLMPANLYGPGDRFDPQNSHVLAALLRKFYEARKSGTSRVTIWGTGLPRREFLHVDDLADACLFTLQASSKDLYSVAPDGILNVGNGEDVEIKELAYLIGEIVGGQFEIDFDLSKPDGTPRKLLDISRMSRLGWQWRISLHEGIRSTYEWMVSNLHASVAA